MPTEKSSPQIPFRLIKEQPPSSRVVHYSCAPAEVDADYSTPLFIPVKTHNGMNTCIPHVTPSCVASRLPDSAFMALPFRSITSVLRPARAASLCPSCDRRGRRSSSGLQPVMKSKRRKSRWNSPEQTSETAAQPPPRVNLENSTLSLRQQLQIARANTETNVSPKPAVRTKFRRKREDVIRSGKRLRDEERIPDGKYDLVHDPIIFVDAYNVIGAWPRLRKWRDRSDMETARRLLLDDIAEYSCVRGWECVVVFDAQGTTEDTKEDRTEENVTVVFTGCESADSYIERCVFELCETGRRQIWAATSDVAQLNFSRAKGAHVMTSNLFIQEVKRARRETKAKLAEIDANNVRGNMLMSTVNEETRNRLYQLRDKLDAS